MLINIYRWIKSNSFTHSALTRLIRSRNCGGLKRSLLVLTFGSTASQLAQHGTITFLVIVCYQSWGAWRGAIHSAMNASMTPSGEWSRILIVRWVGTIAGLCSIKSEKSELSSFEPQLQVLLLTYKSNLISRHAHTTSLKPQMWGGRAPDAQSAAQLAALLTQEWTRAVDQMLRHWSVPPVMTIMQWTQ